MDRKIILKKYLAAKDAEQKYRSQFFAPLHVPISREAYKVWDSLVQKAVEAEMQWKTAIGAHVVTK